MRVISIGTIGNYYGDLEVWENDGKFYWGIPDWDKTREEEIPESLYRELIRFQTGESTRKPPVFSKEDYTKGLQKIGDITVTLGNLEIPPNIIILSGLESKDI